ncbi:MAG: hypothetical protein NTZ90_07320 [Proteobacteria bacterium]|jgi:hypothetical protein|nr:hypothetical protein [Pseudomonadota bacterium]
MADETISATPPHGGTLDGKDLPAPAQLVCHIPSCCIATIFEHVRFNPMMVCSSCKNIIKCFTEERAFQNYLTFCRSRRRTVLTGQVQHYWTIAFRSYDTFNR